MKGFAVGFLTLLITCCVFGEDIREQCHSSACIEANRCNGPVKSSFSCPIEGEVCCSFIKDNEKHRCQHFGGECMKKCADRITVYRADDCEDGSICCVLV